MKKRMAMSAAVASLALGMAHATTYTSASYVQDGLVAQWDGIDNVGTGVHDPTTNVWKDLKGHNDLTLTNGAAWVRGIGLYMDTYAAGKVGAYGTEAAPKYKTIEVVCKISNPTRILFWSGNGVERYLIFDWNVTAPYGQAYFEGTKQQHAYARIKRDEPVVLVATYNDDSVVTDIYCDGVEKFASTLWNDWNPGDGVVSIGCRHVSKTLANYGTKGEIYAIRLYDRVLTSEEIVRNNAIDVKRFFTSAMYEKGGMVSFWDALDNVGVGEHSSTTNFWKNLVAGQQDLELNNSAWSDVALVCNGGTKSGAYGTTTLTYNSLEVLFRYENPDSTSVNAWLFSNGIDRYCVLASGRAQWQNWWGYSASLDTPVSRSSGGMHSLSWVNPGPGAETNAYIDGAKTTYQRNGDAYLDNWNVGDAYVQVGTRSDTGQRYTGRIYSVRAYDSLLSDAQVRANHRIDTVRYANAMRWKGTDGTFGTPGGWRAVDPTQEIPSIDNTVDLPYGTYKVTLDANRTVGALRASNGNVFRSPRIDATLDLGGHALTVMGAYEADNTWGYSNRFSRLTITNGTFKAESAQIGAIYDCIFCEPNTIDYTTAFNVGSGSLVVEGPGTTATFRKELSLVGPFTSLRVAGGAKFSCGGLMVYSRQNRDSAYPADMYDRARVEFTGADTTVDCGKAYIHRDVDIFITDGADVLIRNSSENFSPLGCFISCLGRSYGAFYGNSTHMTVDNATLTLRSTGFVVGACYKAEGGEGTTLTLRNGATLAVTNVYRFVVGSARNENQYNCTNCVLDVLDGSAFVGGANTSLQVGASGNASFCGVNVSNSTACCNILYIGTKQSATCSSNDFLHVAGAAARVDVLSTTADSIRLRTGARLKFSLPENGFTATPLTTAGGVSVVADEASYAVDPVTLVIDASAFDPDRSGRRQTLLTCAADSTTSLQRLADNLTFVNTPARKRGQVFVEDNGTKLVYKGAGGGTMIVVQ